jgi:hypothetical protein
MAEASNDPEGKAPDLCEDGEAAATNQHSAELPSSPAAATELLPETLSATAAPESSQPTELVADQQQASTDTHTNEEATLPPAETNTAHEVSTETPTASVEQPAQENTIPEVLLSASAEEENVAAELIAEFEQEMDLPPGTVSDQAHDVEAAAEALPQSQKGPEEDSPAALLAEVEKVMGHHQSASSKDRWEEAHHAHSQESLRGHSQNNMSRSLPSFGSFEDLKRRTEFSSMTMNGVNKSPNFVTSISNFKSGGKFSFGQKGPSVFAKSSNSPAPGTYTLHNEDKCKFKATPKFSFGGGARFGLGQSPTKKSPGPGAYNPKDPNLATTKVCFGGGGAASRGPKLPEANPGPGSYELKSTVGQGLMFTARGRHPVPFTRSRSLPGPGAYNPSASSVLMQAPKCGFGTSTRTDIAGSARNLVMPGPGTYNMQQVKALGRDAPKYSATSRRRVHDLNSYITPGPGTYNSNLTCFGY